MCLSHSDMRHELRMALTVDAIYPRLVPHRQVFAGMHEFEKGNNNKNKNTNDNNKTITKTKTTTTSTTTTTKFAPKALTRKLFRDNTRLKTKQMTKLKCHLKTKEMTKDKSLLHKQSKGGEPWSGTYQRNRFDEGSIPVDGSSIRTT